MKTSEKLMSAFREFRPHIIGHDIAIAVFLDAVNEVKKHEKAIDEWHSDLSEGLKKLQLDNAKTADFIRDHFKVVTEDLTGIERIPPRTDEQNDFFNNSQEWPAFFMQTTTMSEADFKEKYPHIAMLFEQKCQRCESVLTLEDYCFKPASVGPSTTLGKTCKKCLTTPYDPDHSTTHN